MLGPDAAVAERAHPAAEAAASVGVVQIDVLRIVHHEFDLAERVGRARRLAPADDRAVLHDWHEALLTDNFMGDAGGYFPRRIKHHAHSHCRELRSRRLSRTGDRALLPAIDAVLDERGV